MAIREKAGADIHLDGQQAQDQLRQLKEQAKQLRVELKSMKLADDPGFAKKNRELSSLYSQMKKLEKGSFDLNGTLKNLSGASMKDLSRAQQVLSAQINNTSRKTVEGRAAFAQKTEQLRMVRQELTTLRGQMGATTQSMGLMQRMAGGFNKYSMMIGSFVASLAGIVMGFRAVITIFNDYEEAVANLSAITGVSGEALDWYSERAKAASISTTEHGVRFANSAKEIVDAYTMVGSKRPELLANKEALASVTEQAMILSKAAKIDLEPAATALTTTMNQFNLSATEASRVINTLGAGSKVGAANVSYLNDVIEKSGTSAVSANLSVEQLVGTIEGIAPKFSQPAEAGTALRNVFLRLQGMDDQLNPTIVGWTQSLENLAKRQYSVSELTGMFGMRAINMVQALISGREDIIRYTDAVTNSSIAIEQASINSDTNAARLAQAQNRAQLLRIELGEYLAPALTFSTNSFSYLLKAIKAVIDNWDKYRDLIYASIAVLAAYNYALIAATASKVRLNFITARNNILTKAEIALKASARSATLLMAGAQAILTGNKTRAAAAMRMFNASLAATPWGMVLAAVTAVTAAIVIFIRRKQRMNELEKSSAKIQKEVYQEYDTHEAKIRSLVAIIESSNMSVDRRKKALNELHEIMPEYTGYLTKEGELYEHNTNKIEEYLDALQKRSFLNAIEEEHNELMKRKIQATRDLRAAEEEYEEKKQYHAQRDRAERARDKAKKHYEEIDSAIHSLRNEFAQYSNAITDNTLAVGDNNDALDDLDDLLDNVTSGTTQLTNAYQLLTQALQEARAEMQHLVTIGDFSGAQAINARIAGLQAEKIVIDGILESGGDVIAFLDNMADSTQSELEEMAMFQNQFIDEFSEKSDQWALIKQEQQEEELEREIQEHQDRLDRKEWEAERELQLAEQVAKAKQEITDAALSAGFNMFSMYANAETERELTDLGLRRDRKLANDRLTGEQRQKIEEQFQKEEAKIKKEAFIRQKRADVIQAIINTALAITRALPNPVTATLAGVLGAIQSATIAAQPVPQFFGGRYPVKGASDGKTYMASLAGDPVTGIYKSPALVAEKGEELIVDAPTTRNIRLNYPHLLEAITAARVPQYASGRYAQMASPTQGVESGISEDMILQLSMVISENNKTMQRMSEQIDQGIVANVSLMGNNGFYEKDKEYQQIKKNAYS